MKHRLEVYLRILIEMETCNCHCTLIQAAWSWASFWSGSCCSSLGGALEGPDSACLRAALSMWLKFAGALSSLIISWSSFSLTVIHSLNCAFSRIFEVDFAFPAVMAPVLLWDLDVFLCLFLINWGNLKVSCSKTLGTLTLTCLCTDHVYIAVFIFICWLAIS